MSDEPKERVWSKPVNESKFKLGDNVTPHLLDVEKDPQVMGKPFMVIEILSCGLPKTTRYRLHGSDLLWPESRLKLVS